jgi:hypothetical protein
MPKTYTIAIYRDDLLACVPDGTPLAPYIANMQQFYDKPIFPLAIRVESGLTLTDEAPDDDTFPAWDMRWNTMDVQLQDDTGRVYAFAMRQPPPEEILRRADRRAELFEHMRLLGVARTMLAVSIHAGTMDGAGTVTTIALVQLKKRIRFTLLELDGLASDW